MNTSISPARLPAAPVVQSPPVTPIDDVGYLSLKRELLAVVLAWFAVLGATALGGLL